MKAQGLVFVEKNRCEVETIEVDEHLAPDEVLVRNRVSLISPGTELAFLTRAHRGFDVEWFPYAKYPWRPGYSAVGEVLKVGSAVTEFKAGDRVHNNAHHHTCTKIAASRCLLMPKGLTDEHGAFLQLLKIATSALRRAPVGLGENVVVIGMGIIGNLCAQMCQIAGAAGVAGADLSDVRLGKARVCGIARTWNTGAKPLQEWVKEFSPAQADLIVEAVGSSPTIDAALKAVVVGGRVALLGSPRAKMEIDPYFDIHRKAVQVIGAYASGLPADRQRRDEYWMLSLLEAGRVKVGPLLTHRMPFDKAAEAYVGLREKPDEYLGVMLQYPRV